MVQSFQSLMELLKPLVLYHGVLDVVNKVTMVFMQETILLRSGFKTLLVTWAMQSMHQNKSITKLLQLRS